MESPKNFTFISAQDAYERGFEEARGTALFNSCFLDEPEKPVVPQFVADWYEENKDDFEYNLYRLCIDFCGRKLHEDLHEWFKFDKNKPIETLILMHKFGYEVEKEKLYIAKNKITNSYLGKNGGWSHYGRACSPEIIKHSKSTWRSLGVWDNDLYEITEVKDD